MSREPQQRNDEAAHWAEQDGIDVMTDYNRFTDLSGVIRLLKAGHHGRALIDIAVAELEKVAADPKRLAKVAHRRKTFERERDIVEAFELRVKDWFGDDQARPISAELLAEEFAAKYGFSDTRQVFNILKQAGYKPQGRKKRGI